MIKLSSGHNSTLGNWLALVSAVMGPDCPAAAFLRAEIEKAESGEDEQVLADERQFINVLANMNRGDDDYPHFECPKCHKRSYNTTDIEKGYCAVCKEYFK